MIKTAIPIVQGPMLGASSPEMALAASRAGALGSLGAAGLAPEVLGRTIAGLKESAGDLPFNINLFIQPPARPESAEVARAMVQLAPWRAELGLPEQAIPNRWAEDFASQFAVLVEAAPPVASFTFGILTMEQAAQLKARGTAIVGTATTLAEAKAWQAIGADAVIASGFEGGGHRGSFLKAQEESLNGTLALTSACLAALDIPVIAAGGIGDGRALAGVLALGASAAQLGTAFLLSPESTISQAWRAELIDKSCDDTALTRAFSGRYARGIENRFMRAMAGAEIPAYPVQNALTQELRAQAGKAGRADLLSLWAGQGVHAIRAAPTAQIIETLWQEAREALAKAANTYVFSGSETT